MELLIFLPLPSSHLVQHVRSFRRRYPHWPLGEPRAIEPLLSLRDMEKDAIVDALTRVGNNRRKAADILGISARTLYRKLKEYGIE